MWSYILKRLLLMIPTLFGILLITFVVIRSEEHTSELQSLV